MSSSEDCADDDGIVLFSFSKTHVNLQHLDTKNTENQSSSENSYFSLYKRSYSNISASDLEPLVVTYESIVCTNLMTQSVANIKTQLQPAALYSKKNNEKRKNRYKNKPRSKRVPDRINLDLHTSETNI